MRALLKPVVARELGIVLLKPGSELMPLFSCERVLVESQPAGMERFRLPAMFLTFANNLPVTTPVALLLDEKVIKRLQVGLVVLITGLCVMAVTAASGHTVITIIMS